MASPSISSLYVSSMNVVFVVFVAGTGNIRILFASTRDCWSRQHNKKEEEEHGEYRNEIENSQGYLLVSPGKSYSIVTTMVLSM